MKDGTKPNTESQSPQDGCPSSELQAPNGHTLEAATDECRRENEVRKRCYGKWIDEGRISRTDARDRTERLDAAVWFLKQLEQADPDGVKMVLGVDTPDTEQ